MKKLLSALLIVAMVMAMGVSTFAATYTGFYGTAGLYTGYNIRNSLVGKPGEIKTNSINLGTVYANDKKEVKIGLYNTMFADKNGVQGGYDATTKTVGAPTKLTAADIRDSKITLKTKAMSGSKVFDSIKLDSRNGDIVIKFLTEFVSTKSQDFSVTLSLLLNGNAYAGSDLTVYGTLYNREQEIYGDYDYVDISDGSIAIAEEYVRKIQVDIGSGVSIHTKLFKGKKYYGTANNDATDQDIEIMQKYPDIDNVIILKTVGLNSTGDVVQLESGLSGYYVYDGNLKFLGRSNRMLPYSTRYYLARSNLNTGTETATEQPTQTTTKPTQATTEETKAVALTKAKVTSLFNTANKKSTSKAVTVTAGDISSVSKSVLGDLKKLADKAKKTTTLVIERKSGKTVQTRLYINPGKATKDINTLVTMGDSSAKATQKKFDGWFRNDLFVVHTNQKGDYGMNVSLAVKKPTNFETSNLYFYSYNASANSYKRITKPEYRVDNNGYIHFTTKQAGDIVISDGVLKK